MVNILFFSNVQVFAHEIELNVKYDECLYDENGDSIYEMWYAIEDKYSRYYHINDNVLTIKYYFEESSPSGYTWTTHVSESVAEEIKNAYASSMKKWNNVYFYSYNEDGTVTKNKIINVVEGSNEDYNIKIYPGTSGGSQAKTIPSSGYSEPGNGSAGMHCHYTKWEMYVYVNSFYENTYNSLIDAEFFRDRVGAHEIGHVLGLRDIDDENLCKATENIEHHHELLMGYGDPITARSSEITYKDIAGVAITRGFHTDADHKWLNLGIQNNGTYKLLCSICNGVKYVDSLSGYTYDTYGLCGDNHNLSDGNMMAVASYGDQDYYKCKYCRYVEPFSSIVTQNYSKSAYSPDFHKCTSTVDGLSYSFYEEHTYNNSYSTHSATQHKAYCECGEYILEEHLNFKANPCSLCGEPHTHDYSDHYARETSLAHRSYCACGESRLSAHVVSGSSGGVLGKKRCIFCGEMVTTGQSIMSTTHLPHTENGSYIMPNGIIVLMDEDIETYLDGTLEFIYPTDEETE